ncbi:MAG: peptidase M28, partial [Candidatus Nephrothrix sp. EaCA]
MYNGALDNASGVAALLEFARAFKAEKTPPERSVLFISVTGEEQGLLGSDYYAHHPVFPLKNTVANVNFDGVNNIGRCHDVVIVGKGQSELEDIFEKYAKEQNRYVTEEPKPQNGNYFRSDHFCFAKVGV